MAVTPKENKNGKYHLYLLLAVVGIWVSWLVLKFLYYAFSYLGLNLFLALDLSAYGRLSQGGWIGYALLGLGLGAAGGAVAAQRRFRLNKLIPAGAGVLVLGLCSFVFLNNAARFAPPVMEAAHYVRSEGQGQCPACTTIEASSTKSDPEQNRYTAAALLDKNNATAWISDEADNQNLRLTLTIPADQRLVGLRLSNGYGKSEEVFASFSRVRTCRVSLDNGPETPWALPDTRNEDLFIPLTPVNGAKPLVLLFRIDETYSGENHSEVALSSLTPVIEAASIPIP